MNKQGYQLHKKKFSKLFTLLKANAKEIIAPVKNINEAFPRMQKVESLEEIHYEGISWFTSKKYVFPEKQELFSFKGNKITTWKETPKKRILFGLRLCDLNAFHINDHLFLHEDPALEFYKKFRKNLTLIGLWCHKPQDQYCFCDSMNLKHQYDLCLFDRGEYWHLKTGSTKGEALLAPLLKNSWNLLNRPLKKEEYTPSPPKGKTKLNTHEIKELFNKKEIWQKGAEDCLSCGDCTTLCPTCLCFDLEDESDLNVTCGKRCAKWDSCMYKDFTLVAGGHTFREKREDRFKHRIFHKLQYFKKQFNELMCTGCGRCLRGCPTKIDWLQLLNENTKKQ